jgi:hypothetical protein
MKIELMDHITLENNRNYIVSNITKFNNMEYYLLLNIDDDSDIMIAYLDNSNLVSIENIDEYINILKEFDTGKILNKFSIEEIINLKSNYDE